MKDKKTEIHRNPTKPVFPSFFEGFRSQERIPVNTEVVVRDGTGFEVCLEAANLSKSGVFLKSPYLYDRGTEHQLGFWDKDQGVWIFIRSRVVRTSADSPQRRQQSSEDAGMGYEFIVDHDDERDRRNIDRLGALMSSYQAPPSM